MAEIKFVQARQFTRTSGRTINFCVLHSAEGPERDRTAENVAAYFATLDRRASAHYTVDNDSIVQSVLDKDVAYGAPSLNNDALHWEHAGYARQSRAEWLDAYGLSMLALSGAHVASKLKALGLPIRFASAADLVKFRQTRDPNLRGITTHAEASKAFKPGGHWDPGPHFPMDTYLEIVRSAYGPTKPPEDPMADNRDIINAINAADARPRAMRDESDDKVYVVTPFGKTFVNRLELDGHYITGLVQPDPNNQPQKVKHEYLAAIPTVS